MSDNPLIGLKRIGKYQAIPFDEINIEHFMPAIELGLRQAEVKLEEIKCNLEEASFENTVKAMSELSEVFDTAPSIYYNLMSSNSDDEFKKLAQQISPMMSQFSSKMIADPVLFERVKHVYETRNESGLSAEQIRMVELQYKGFCRNGALLSDEDKEKLQKLDMELSKLSPQFMQNVLGSTNSYQLHITEAEKVKGIPENALKAAAFLAKKKGLEEGWLFNLQIPSLLPVLNYCENRETRKELSIAYNSKAFRDDFDNQELVKKISCLRYDRAQLLGYKSHAAFVLEQRMAESQEKVYEFLDGLYDASIEAAKEELEELQKFANELDGIEELKPWDMGYYSEKLKQKKFDFNTEELRPYFRMENVIDGMFKTANKLYGIKFNKLSDVPVYHEDVQVFEVTEEDGEYIGLIYIDLFPRETKRGGAWMTNYQSQGFSYGREHKPHVSIVANLTPPTEDTPSLMNLDEVTTMFHEFGHSLHGLLSNVKVSSLASPNVYWDFVELPSQIMENWVIEKETLELFAYHYETNELIPDELIEKIKKSMKYRAGSNSLRQLMLGYLDMAWHSVDPTDIEDVSAYENKAIEKTALTEIPEYRNISCSYSHIFAGGYSSGYYSYKWAEVLEADAFEKFKEDGIFNKETALSFRNNVLAKGNTAEPMDLYVNFRGRKPDPQALLRRSGLI